MIHAQLGICGGCITAKAYEGMDDIGSVYFVKHSMASEDLIKKKFGEKAEKVNIAKLEGLPEDEIGIVEGPICFQGKEESIQILKTVREKVKRLLGLGICVCGDGKDLGGLISPICSEEMDTFCEYARVRHIPPVGVVDFDYVVPLCSPHPKGVSMIIKALMENDEDYLKPFKEMARTKRARTIQHDVIEEGICVGCGSCATVCPTRCITLTYGVPRIEHAVDRNKCIRCGTCYFQCPRSFIDLKSLQNMVFAKQPEDETIGVYIDAYSSRATEGEILKRAQDGGVGTALLLYALEEGIIDGAVTAMKNKPWEPIPFVARSREDLLSAAGTKYTVASNMITLRTAIRDQGFKKLGYVGTPCNVQALRKMELYPVGAREIPEGIEFIIGLFCMENFFYGDIRSIVEYESSVDISKVKKMDIKKGKFWVYTTDGDIISIDLDKTLKYAQPSCHLCLDYTSELADISIGGVGSPAGRSTVLIRNEKGKDIFENAIEKGYVEAIPLEEVKPGIGLVKRLANTKKTKNMEEVLKRKEEGRVVPYLS
jgi:coenzyme F420 hydrogenase subunit beta